MRLNLSRTHNKALLLHSMKRIRLCNVSSIAKVHILQPNRKKGSEWVTQVDSFANNGCSEHKHCE